MQVVEDENERPVRGEALEQKAHRSMAPVALVRHGCARAVDRAVDQRQDLREVRQHIEAQRLENRRRQPPHIFLERICDHPERHVAVEL